MSDLDRIRLVVLFGGQSAEHDVSCVTARHVVAAVDPARYEVVPVGITRNGRWVLAEEAAAALHRGAAALPDALSPTGPAYELLPTVQGGAGDAPVVVFPLLHGPLGEDGTVQGLLELAGVPYVGCGVLSSALTMDKAIAKEVLAAAGVPQARHLVVHADELGERADPGGELVARLVDELGLPCFVKPANMGSSIGVTKAADAVGLAVALDLAASYDEWLVVEEAIVGREIECSLLGNRDVRVSVPGEIRPGAEFYTYDDKYHDGRAELIIPAELPPAVVAALEDLAVRAYRALRCEGMARADFLYEEGTATSPGRGLLVNELNTIPGFTPISMYPKLWAASGLTYPDLIDELVRLAFERHGRARRRTDRGR